MTIELDEFLFSSHLQTTRNHAEEECQTDGQKCALDWMASIRRQLYNILADIFIDFYYLLLSCEHWVKSTKSHGSRKEFSSLLIEWFFFTSIEESVRSTFVHIVIFRSLLRWSSMLSLEYRWPWFVEWSWTKSSTIFFLKTNWRSLRTSPSMFGLLFNYHRSQRRCSCL